MQASGLQLDTEMSQERKQLLLLYNKGYSPPELLQPGHSSLGLSKV